MFGRRNKKRTPRHPPINRTYDNTEPKMLPITRKFTNCWPFINRREWDVIDITIRLSALVVFELKYDHSTYERSFTLLNFRWEWA